MQQLVTGYKASSQRSNYFFWLQGFTLKKKSEAQPPKWNNTLYRVLWRAAFLSPGQPPLSPPCHPLTFKSLTTPLVFDEMWGKGLKPLFTWHWDLFWGCVYLGKKGLILLLLLLLLLLFVVCFCFECGKGVCEGVCVCVLLGPTSHGFSTSLTANFTVLCNLRKMRPIFLTKMGPMSKDVLTEKLIHFCSTSKFTRTCNTLPQVLQDFS